MVQLSKAGIAKKAKTRGRIDYLDMVIQDTRDYMSELSSASRQYRETYKECQTKGLTTYQEQFFRLWKETEGKLSESKRYLSMFERTRAGYEWELKQNEQ